MRNLFCGKTDFTEEFMFTLMENGTVVTPTEIIDNGGVLFRDGVIEDIGSGSELKLRFFRKFGKRLN